MKRQYQDKYGDMWERLDEFYVRRLRDGNIGLWNYGIGLFVCE